jgi:two-component system sensor histidine kinase AlgZ
VSTRSRNPTAAGLVPQTLRELYAETLAGVLAPRRLLPLAVVATPLVVAQFAFSSVKGPATALALAELIVFVLVAPFAWRALFPEESPWSWWPLRLVAYAVLGGIPAAVGILMPEVFGLGRNFLNVGVNVAVMAGLFWVGGWGLGRDVGLENSLRREQARRAAMEREAEQAQLLALRAHLDPHFLFNTLNAIAEWCQEDPSTAEAAILRLSGLLRELLGGITAPRWPLARELQLARDVWALHRLRDPDWFTVEWDVPEPVPDVDLPPMVLLPLIENAVKHGPAKGHRGVLRLEVQVSNTALDARVSNPGPAGPDREGGTGLSTVRRRIVLAYGPTASLTLTGTERAVAHLHLPLESR